MRCVVVLIRRRCLVLATYFLVEDADAAIERIKELGGSVIDGPMDSPYGRIATVAGPDAAAFQIVNVPQNS